MGYKDNFCSLERLRYYNGIDISSAVFVDYCGPFPPSLPISSINGVAFEFASATSGLFEIIYEAVNSSDLLRNQSNEAFREYPVLFRGRCPLVLNFHLDLQKENHSIGR